MKNRRKSLWLAAILLLVCMVLPSTVLADRLQPGDVLFVLEILDEEDEVLAKWYYMEGDFTPGGVSSLEEAVKKVVYGPTDIRFRVYTRDGVTVDLAPVDAIDGTGMAQILNLSDAPDLVEAKATEIYTVEKDVEVTTSNLEETHANQFLILVHKGEEYALERLWINTSLEAATTPSDEITVDLETAFLYFVLYNERDNGITNGVGELSLTGNDLVFDPAALPTYEMDVYRIPSVYLYSSRTKGIAVKIVDAVALNESLKEKGEGQTLTEYLPTYFADLFILDDSMNTETFTLVPGENLFYVEMTVNGQKAYAAIKLNYSEEGLYEVTYTDADGEVAEIFTESTSSNIGPSFSAPSSIRFAVTGGYPLTVNGHYVVGPEVVPLGSSTFVLSVAGGEPHYFYCTGVGENIDFAKAHSLKLPYVDVDWLENRMNCIQHCYNEGLMNGIDPTHFGPETKASRGMVVTVLYRIAGSPEVEGELPFADVDPTAYYADAVLWASQNGIVTGKTETTFDPDADITREQLSAILMRYAKTLSPDFTYTPQAQKPADYDSVAEYAKDAVLLAADMGMLWYSAQNNQYMAQPTDTVSRAELAVAIAALDVNLLPMLQ